MKKINTLLCLSLIIISALGISCTKEGPQGPKGEDAITLCIQCHTETIMSAIEDEYEESAHGMGGAVSYAGKRYDCAKCHSHEGFTETQRTGRDTTAYDVSIPTRISCETCHSGRHRSFDVETDGNDYALRTVASFDLMAIDETMNLGDESNLCANCHQPRADAPVADGDGNFYVSSFRYGPHHGPQSTVLAGIGGYTFDGTVVESEVHVSAKATCTSCHMHNGDHTFEPSLNACATCHGDIDNFDLGGTQTEIAGLMANLEAALKTKGLLDASGAPVVGTYPVAQAGALFNYRVVLEDRSKGVHNYPYTKDLLEASIAALQ